MSIAIGILSLRDDIHALAIKKNIEDRHQVRCHLFAGKELATKGGLSWSDGCDSPSVLLDADGQLVEVRTLDALWYRRLPMHQIIPDDVEPKYKEEIDAACWTALQGHLMTEFCGRWISEPIATELAENKLLQLRAARGAGLRIPATLVSQDPARIRAFCAAHPGAIIKPLRSRGELAITAVVSAALLEQTEVLALEPAIYQENIPGNCHLRVTMFGPYCHAVVIEARELDWRVDVSVPFRIFELPPPLRAALQDVLHALGLVMGIFDLKLTPAGDAVFFEVNPQGQFLFVEGLCQLPLADTLADYLVQEAREHACAPIAERQPATLGPPRTYRVPVSERTRDTRAAG